MVFFRINFQNKNKAGNQLINLALSLLATTPTKAILLDFHSNLGTIFAPNYFDMIIIISETQGSSEHLSATHAACNGCIPATNKRYR